MANENGRREFLQLMGLGGVVFASGLAGCATAGGAGSKAAGADDFFLQLTDTHWGFKGPPNPEAANTLRQAVAAVNALPAPPDFVFFTGDLTHTTDDEAERRRRMAEFKEITAALRTPKVYYVPGEHDASLDAGKAFIDNFGATRQSFDHKGIHFVALDNVSDPAGALGEAQLDWLAKDLAAQRKDAPIVVLTHRPLFDLYPQWDWATKDGAKAIDVLQAYKNVTVFYGHIHQEHHFKTGEIAHHASASLIFPMPPPGSQPKRAPIPWDPTHPRKGLGFREVRSSGALVSAVEHTLEGAA
jgi:predicted phosphodiesterase